MTFFEASHALPSQAMLDGILAGYFRDGSSDPAELDVVLNATFSTYAEQHLSVERALATVMTAVDRAAGGRSGAANPSTRALKRVVTKCCLAQYFTDLGPVGR